MNVPVTGPVPYGRKTQNPPKLEEVHVLWITAGLSCDGDSVSITGATNPSIEDVMLGAIPGLPKVHLHNPVLAYEVGDEFLEHFLPGGAGEARTFVLVVEGSIPNEKIKQRRLLGRAWPRTAKPASPSAPVNGSTGSRPRRWR